MLTIGVDLAQSRDRTVLVAVDSFRLEPEPTIEEMNAINPVRDALRGRVRTPRAQLHHEIVHIDRLPAGIGYPEQVVRIVQTASALSVEETAGLVVDATGVGRPVVDMIRSACEFPLRAVTITGGSEVVKAGRDYSVPKADLVGVLEVTLSTRQLHVVAGLPHTEELDKELRAFGYELGVTGKPRYEGKGAHDDIVTALSLALWGVEHGASYGRDFKEFMRKDMERRRASSSNAASSW